MLTSDFETNQTAEFIRSRLGGGALTVLDVGCGDGLLAAMLQHSGYEVTGIEPSTTEAVIARRRGVRCHEIAWLEYSSAHTFDAIVFNRSLHHLQPIATAVEYAVRLLAPAGHVLVEDFSYAGASSATVEWFCDVLANAERAGWIAGPLDEGGFAAKMLRHGAAAWPWAGHEHSGMEIEAAITANLGTVESMRVPYLYRHVARIASPDGARWAFDAECEAAASGRIDLVGRRYVARH